MKMEEEFYRQRLLNEYVRSIASSSGSSGGAASSTSGAGTVAVAPTSGESVLRIPSNTWSEREWDQFFRRLEERFDAVDVLPEYRTLLTRRFLRGPQLYNWIDLSKKEGATYESTRDEFIKSYFPGSDLYQSMLKVLLTPADRSAPSVETAAPSEADSQQGAKTTQRRAPNASLNVVRSRAQAYRESMSRVAARTGMEMPEEQVWISWATSLMRPSLYEAYLTLENPPASLAELLNCLVDPQAKESSSERRHSGRKYRRQKAAAAAAAAAGGSVVTQSVGPVSSSGSQPQKSAAAVTTATMTKPQVSNGPAKTGQRANSPTTTTTSASPVKEPVSATIE